MSAIETAVQKEPPSLAPDLSDCRCIRCEAGALAMNEPIDPARVQPGALGCGACGARYDVIHGVPYLLALEESDFVALVEIAGEYDSPSYELGQFKPMDDSWPRTLAACKEASDYEAFKASLAPGYAAGLDDRYDQYRMLDVLTGEMDLRGKKVLVVGAGLGFDTNLLMYRGARCTAVDLNPQTNTIGAIQTPRARWIGALGRRLPFIDAAFDHVFISASLHHVLDVSATIVEMLRVLKPGGSLVTTNDSHSADATSDLEDARFWNDHQDVLRGINENTPRLKVYIDPILERIDDLDVDFWTHRAFGLWVEEENARKNLLEPRRWDLKRDHVRLRETGGGIFMRVTPRKQIANPLPPPGPSVVTPAELFSFVGRKREAMACIARLAPAHLVSPLFPGPAGNTKFQLLNGWRWTEPGEQGRDAYLCGRWYVRRDKRQKKLVVEVFPKRIGAPDPEVTVAVDGAVKKAFRVARGSRKKVVVDIADTPVDRPMALEVSMSPPGEGLEQRLLRVMRLDVM
ncbi:MAG: class I SAM-dependent methyltransferase [Hyphomonadaceae bacterium]|nr:class I SAM-dependent methyltransferase [Hyphomonadaceae bacterium]